MENLDLTDQNHSQHGAGSNGVVINLQQQKSSNTASEHEEDHNLRLFIRKRFTQKEKASGQTKKTPTAAFGRIDFVDDALSRYNPPYVRLSDEDPQQDAFDLMASYWKLPRPKLVLSIVGGARRFQFTKSKISQLFNKGLLDIATTTGAWLLTPGSNVGVYKMIGSGVRDHINAAGSAAVNDIVLIGIACWGSVPSREKLVDIRGTGLFPADYKISDIKTDRDQKVQQLDPHHTHFILVDDGSRGAFDGEAEWRAKFEKFLSDCQLTEDTHNQSQVGSQIIESISIPVVTVLVNGGDGSLENIKLNLQNGLSVVVISGSGRAAEVIEKLYIYWMSVEKAPDWIPDDKILTQIYLSSMKNRKEVDPKVLADLKVICRSQNIKRVTVCDFTKMNRDGEVHSLSRFVLSALYPADEITINDRKAQLRLALAWNFVDFASDVIFDANNSDYYALTNQREFLNELMVDALIEDKHQFVLLFIEHGLNMDDIVTESRLKDLYQSGCARSGDPFSGYMKDLIESHHLQGDQGCCTSSCGCNRVAVSDSGTYSLHVIGLVIKKLLGYSYPNIYRGDNTTQQQFTSRGLVKLSAAQHLFFWCLLFNRVEMAQYFWKITADHIAGAIVGAAVLRGLAKRSDHNEGVDITASYLKNSLKFEALANGILDICWRKDRQLTSDMLIRSCRSWGGITVLSMAHAADMEEFLAQSACYTKLEKLWRGDIALRTSVWRILVFSLCPLAVSLLKFVRKRDSDTRTDESNQLPPIDDADMTEVTRAHGYKPVLHVSCCGNRNDEIAFLRSIYRAISAPMVKCIHYSLYFTAFLVVYSLFLMTELQEYNPISSVNSTTANGTSEGSTCTHCCLGVIPIGCFEICTYAFVAAYVTDEIRQIFFKDGRSLRYASAMLMEWTKDLWNFLDATAFLIFLAAVVMRFTVTGDAFEVVRWFFSFSLGVYVIRFNQIFFAMRQIGPKIIMIRNMLLDLQFFIIILLIVTVAFGVISESIQNPNSPLEWLLLWRIIYKPYWNMYGELFLEDFNNQYHSVLLMGYMLFTNILILNLLIAMFSYTFDNMQQRSEILWKYHYYTVVKENFDRPHLLFFGSIYQMIRHTNCRCCPNKQSRHSTFCRTMEPAEDEKLDSFVKICMEKHMANESYLLTQNLTHKVENTAERLDRVIGQLDDLRDDILRRQGMAGDMMSISDYRI